MRLLAIGVALLLLFGVQAAQPASGTSWTWSKGVVRQVLEGMDTPQPPDGHFPKNTTDCTWNDEDQIEDVGSGTLVGEITDNLCLVADLDGWYGHAGTAVYPKLLITKVFAPTSALAVWITNDVGDRWDAPPPVAASRHQYAYGLCVQDPVADAANIFGWEQLDYWPIIPGTNGGHGQIVTYTLHVAIAKKTPNISVYFEAGYNDLHSGSFVNDIQSWGDRVPCPAQDG